jgi:subfamily B ATP-binding cassette protein MsbA
MKLEIRHTTRLAKFVLPHWRGLALATFFSLLAAAGQAARLLLLIPMVRLFPSSDKASALASQAPDRLRAFVESVLDIAGPDVSPEEVLVAVAVAGAVLAVVGAIGSYGQEYCGKWVRHRAEIDAQNRVFAHLSTLSLRFFHRSRSGELVSRLTNDLALTRKAVEFIAGDMIEQPPRIVASAAILFAKSWALGLVAIALYPILVVPMVRAGRKIRKSAKKRQSQQADVTDSMLQAITGIRIVKAFNRGAEEERRFREQTDEYFKRSMKVVRHKAMMRSFVEFTYSAGFIAFFVVGGILVVKGIVPLEADTFAMFFAALAQMYMPIKSLSNAFSEVQESFAGADRLFGLLDEKATVVDAPGARRFGGIRSDIAFKGVEFTYDHTPVLRDVSFKARRGDVVALVGPSGAGKSTLCDLIARFHDPVSGAIEIDGEDVRRYTIASMLDHVAIVTQDAFLFNTTVEENILYGRLGASREDVEAAARAAHIHDFIMTLPEGYATNVGERGAKLSGGQKQRITIARAILKNAPILILDEATSSLDSESEAAIQDALSFLMKGRTTFVIAHRLSTVQHADQILVLEGGRIVERGRHDELLAMGGVYRRLHQLQFRDGPHEAPS